MPVDGILDLYLNVVDGLVVYEKVIQQASDGRASIYGNREYHDGCGESRR